MAAIVVSGAHDPRSVHSLTPSLIGDWIERIAAWGFTSARTNALSPPIARIFDLAGFTVAQDLSLLEFSAASTVAAPDTDRQDITALNPRSWLDARNRGARTEILRIDQASFPATWALDASSLRDALAATPVTRLFLSTNGGSVLGFVILGVSDGVAYVQRLAVAPGHRRGGVARQLLIEAMQWATDGGADRVIVNTEVSNTAALGLYQSLGFATLPQGLFVMHRDLR